MDRDGRGKQSHGLLAGVVCVVGGCLLRTPEVLHVAEGIADALAIAARHSGGASVATGGAAALRHLLPGLTAIGAALTLWPGDDTSKRAAVRRLAAELERLGAAVRIADNRDGDTPRARVRRKPTPL